MNPIEWQIAVLASVGIDADKVERVVVDMDGTGPEFIVKWAPPEFEPGTIPPPMERFRLEPVDDATPLRPPINMLRRETVVALLAEEEAELKLRVVASPEHRDDLFHSAETLTALYADEHIIGARSIPAGQTPYSVALDTVYDWYIRTGTLFRGQNRLDHRQATKEDTPNDPST